MKTLIRLALTVSLLAVATAANAQNGYYAAGYYAAPQAQAAYAQEQANAQAWAAYNAQQQANAAGWARYYADQAAAKQAAAQRAAASRPAVGNSQIRFDGRFASVGQTAPQALQFAVYAANTLQNKPYVLGGGHRNIEDSAYDCSSSTSYVLMKAGLLNRCLSSKEFANSGQLTGEGPRWRTKGRNYAGFSPRHPSGM
ncbi:MAG: hypothetical protein B7Z37_24125 [Verrucomicrobia bacterium 12-59-8]|nr:MAG: hypothetical protein B7Z37_24125 [Verrucomicrobia bacterium 12-59-8]